MIAAEFSIPYKHYLSEEGVLSSECPTGILSSEELLKLYEAMCLLRAFDVKAVKLQRTGQLGTYPSCLGQEAISVAVGHAMKSSDVLVPSYREQGIMMMRGVLMEEVLLYWGGDERGSDYQNCPNDLPISVPISSHLSHAVGVAFANAYQGKSDAVLTCCGDGGTSKGDFAESLNYAGVWNLPVVFLVSNNQWAISVPLKKQTISETIAQKAIFAGIEGIQVDGNDLLAMTEVVSYALDKARAGNGPTLIEAVTYRLGDHTTADDATRYRTAEELELAKTKEPIKRLKAFLSNKGLLSKEEDFAIEERCQLKVNAAVDAYLKMPKQELSSIFEYMYHEMPEELQLQLQALEDR